jgi:asparagine synthase (glutamine-hydrolysing)
MCGIVGCVKSNFVDLSEALKSIEYRGPDYSDTYYEVVDLSYIGLGHNRLSIIDLDESSNQPFTDGLGSVMVYNGEIYNFKELREILISQGDVFHTNGDTEVLFKWFKKYGIEGLNSLDGMFAFAYLNLYENTLYLIRDHLGIKPLYYNLTNGLVFSSEIRAIHKLEPTSRIIDISLLTEYLIAGFIYEPETGFMHINKVPQGSALIFDLKNYESTIVSYWNCSTSDVLKSMDMEKLISKSVYAQTVADVPVGLFFSGGVDSSIILKNLNNDVKCITVKSSEDDYDKAGMADDYFYAKKISKIFNRQIYPIEINDDIKNCEDFLNAISLVAEGNEELMYDFTYFSSLRLSQVARQNNCTVMLSGMGADEIFAGYSRYKLLHYRKFIKPFLPLVKIFLSNNKFFSKKYERFNEFFNADSFHLIYNALVGVFSSSEVKLLLGDKFNLHRFEQKQIEILKTVENESDLKKAMFLDLRGFLAHNFMVADKSSMKASIEMRVPMATKSLYEHAFSIPDKRLIKNGTTKVILKEILLKYLPEKLVYRKKAGFNAPIDNFINLFNKNDLMDVYGGLGLFKLLNKDVVESIVQKHFDRNANNTYKLYQLLHLSFWLKNYDI